MPKTIVILQPGYLPWQGFFEQLDRADVFVLFDNVQYDRSWRNRNRIKTAYEINGTHWQWLTVPVKAHGLPSIKEVRIADHKWPKRHIGIIENNYGKAKFFANYFPEIVSTLTNDRFDFLVDLDYTLIKLISKWLGINSDKIVLSSKLNLELPQGKTEKNVAICKALGATRFYEAAAGINFFDSGKFTKAGIELVYQDYKHPTYTQLHGQFISHLSVIDLIFNEGPKSLEIIRQGGKK